MDEILNPNDAIRSPFYPLVLYRDGSQFVWDGRATDSMTVGNADEHEEARSAGWVEGADYPNAGKAQPNLLDLSAGKIADLLPTFNLEQLEAYREDEIAGKSRKGVLALLDIAIDEKLKG